MDKWEKFLESVIDNKIILIGGQTNSGKTIISSLIANYLNITQKRTIHINQEFINNDRYNENTISFNLSTYDDVNDYVKNIKDSIIVIEDFNYLSSINNYSNNSNTTRALLISRLIENINSYLLKNNLTIIISVNTYNDFLGNSNHLSMPSSTIYIADTVLICKKDELSNMSVSVEKTRNYVDDELLPFKPTRFGLNHILRRLKIKKLLENN